MAQRGKIDKSHGFMKEITRNQIERDKYHDERAKTLQLKKSFYDSYLSNNEIEGTCYLQWHLHNPTLIRIKINCLIRKVKMYFKTLICIQRLCRIR